jgi:hypothetical protein
MLRWRPYSSAGVAESGHLIFVVCKRLIDLIETMPKAGNRRVAAK